MWTNASKKLSFSGTLRVTIRPGFTLPIGGVLVDVYRFREEDGGEYRFDLLNTVSARTDGHAASLGGFSFSELPVVVKVKTVIPSTPPYTPVEVVQHDSLPDLVFRVYVESEALTPGSALPGNRYTEIFDERPLVTREWVTAHAERVNVSLTGASIMVTIPEGNGRAIELAGISYVPPAVMGKEFHFLRVGRAVREEIGELVSAKPGYMNSVAASFIPGIVDAPFGGTLHIGGVFGSDLATIGNNLYYAISFENQTAPKVTRSVTDPLFNRYYVLPTTPDDPGKWMTLDLGPFSGTVAGAPVSVYRMRPAPNPLTEYWPFGDLVVNWNSAQAPNDLCLMKIEIYERTGGTDTNPVLKKVTLSSPAHVNRSLPLRIDNSPPVPVLLPFDPAETARKFSTAFASFSAVAEPVGPSTPLPVCNELAVTTPQPTGNECLLVRYQIEDGAGSAHKHVASYGWYAEFTPKAVGSAPDTAPITLHGSFSGHYPFPPNDAYRSIRGSYVPVAPPVMEVWDAKSVIVPQALNGWPPENGDPYAGGAPCLQYAVEVGFSCSVRTIDGWGYLFGTPHKSRHLIVRKG